MVRYRERLRLSLELGRPVAPPARSKLSPEQRREKHKIFMREWRAKQQQGKIVAVEQEISISPSPQEI